MIIQASNGRSLSSMQTQWLRSCRCKALRHSSIASSVNGQQHNRRRIRQHRHNRVQPVSSAASEGEDGGAVHVGGSLSATIKRKHRQIQARIDELGLDALQEQLQNAIQQPASPEFRLSTLITMLRSQQGRPAIVVEVRRSTGGDGGISSPQELAEAAQAAVDDGADAIVVLTDAEATPAGLADLFAVCRTVSVPVLARDWFLHPIQIVDAKEAGAAGVLGVIASVSGRGTPTLSSFASALGMEAPVEVVNLQESDAMERAGVPFIGVNMAVGLSLSMPSLAVQIADSLVQNQAHGNLTIVGIRTMADANRARNAGADALFLRSNFAEATLDALTMNYNPDRGSPLKAVLDELKAALTGEL